MINLKPQFNDMGRYLEATDILNFNYPVTVGITYVITLYSVNPFTILVIAPVVNYT